jgi:hypothetical protein
VLTSWPAATVICVNASHRPRPSIYRGATRLPYDTGDETSIVIEATADPRHDDDSTDAEGAKWQVRTFPTEVCRHFVMLSVYGTPMRGRDFLDVARTVLDRPSRKQMRDLQTI